MNLKRLWQFSSQIHTEIFLGSRIQAAGNNKEVILDKYQNNLNEIKSNSKFSSLIVASILIVPAFIAVETLDQSFTRLATDNIQKVFFTNSMAIATYYMFNLIFMLLFGLMTIASLLKGHVFKFLHTLPFSKSEIQMLGMMTYVRLLLYQFVIILLVFPLGLLYITRSPLIFLVAVLVNTGNIIISSYILIILIEKLTGLLFSKDNRVGWRSLFRYLFLVLYVVSIFSIYYVVGSLGTLINSLYDLNFLPEATLGNLNLILAAFPFPFSTGYVVSMVTLGQVPNNLILLTTGIGLILYIVMMWMVIKRGNRIMLNIAFKQPMENIEEEKRDNSVLVTKRTPLRGYLRMNLMIISRDVSSLISLTLAILFPILPLIQGTANENPFTGFLFYSGFIIFFSSNAISSSEGSIGGLLSSLPISHRMIFRVKQLLLALIFLVAFIIFSLVAGFEYIGFQGLGVILVLSILLPNTFLIFKSYLFGKINGEYTLFDVESDSSFFRNTGLIIPVMIVVGFEFLLFYSGFNFGLDRNIMILLGNALLWIFLEGINRRMFR